VCAYHADFARPSIRPLPITWSLAGYRRPLHVGSTPRLNFQLLHTRLAIPKSAESKLVLTADPHPLDLPFSRHNRLFFSPSTLKSSRPLTSLSLLRIPPQTFSSLSSRLAFYTSNGLSLKPTLLRPAKTCLPSVFLQPIQLHKLGQPFIIGFHQHQP
jgi:hypothetical protein